MTKMKSLTLMRRIQRGLLRKFRKFFGVSITYRYRKFSIYLPADHMLPDYQRIHPKYDRFLPHLAKHLQGEGVVIDVGANVGDTFAAMYEANHRLRYVCIEPDDEFFRVLMRNIERIRSSEEVFYVRAIKALVGKGVSVSSLEGRGGTKHAVLGVSKGIKSEPLDELISADEQVALRLLKTDVDGFDYDVIDSALSVIKQARPLIYFELQCDSRNQYDGYLTTLKRLEEEGYTDWFLFDNYGGFMLHARSVEIIEQVMSYIWRQTMGHSTRAIYYLDVLAAQKGDVDFINEVLETY